MGYRYNVPLTENDIGDLNSINLDRMSVEDLKALQYRLEDLRYDMECGEPADRGSIEYRFWDRRLCKVEDFLDSVLDLLEQLEKNTPARETAFPVSRYIPVTET